MLTTATAHNILHDLILRYTGCIQLIIYCTILCGRFKGSSSSLYLTDSCLCSMYSLEHRQLIEEPSLVLTLPEDRGELDESVASICDHWIPVLLLISQPKLKNMSKRLSFLFLSTHVTLYFLCHGRIVAECISLWATPVICQSWDISAASLPQTSSADCQIL